VVVDPDDTLGQINPRRRRNKDNSVERKSAIADEVGKEFRVRTYRGNSQEEHGGTVFST